MKKRFFFAVALLGGVVVMSSCSKQAAESEEKQGTEQAAMPEVAAIRVAGELAQYGVDNQSAISLINAADILASTPRVTLEAEVTASEQTENVGEKSSQITLDPVALLESARTLANGDDTLLGLIAKVEEKLAEQVTNEGDSHSVTGASFASLTYGNGAARYNCAAVYANGRDSYNISFSGGRFAEIAIVGDGDTDLDLYVYDANGNLVAKDDTYSGHCYVSFYPSYTSTFRVRVVNRGSVYNNYCIATN